MTEVFPGVHWLKLPISMDEGGIDHINVYLIQGGDGWLLIDAGFNTDESFSTLHNYLVKNRLGFEDIKQIVVTHVHPDHYGMAGRVKKLSGATLAMHYIEKDAIEPRYVSMEELLHQTDRALVANGVPEAEMVPMRDATIGLQNYVVPSLPDIIYHNGETLTAGDFTFRVIWTPGHSSGHICLYEPVKKIFLSGDHILPKITPNISVNPLSIENPLGRYLDSLAEIRELDVELVLPGHDEPFKEWRRRIDKIARHHEVRNREILAVMDTKMRTPYQIALGVTWGFTGKWQDLPAFHQRMAVFETVAHLDMMAAEERVDRVPRGGVAHYRRK